MVVRIEATWLSGTCAPLLPVTSTSPSCCGLARKSRAYRTRTGNRCRPSMVVVRFLPPMAVSITSSTSPTFNP